MADFSIIANQLKNDSLRVKELYQKAIASTDKYDVEGRTEGEIITRRWRAFSSQLESVAFNRSDTIAISLSLLRDILDGEVLDKFDAAQDQLNKMQAVSQVFTGKVEFYLSTAAVVADPGANSAANMFKSFWEKVLVNFPNLGSYNPDKYKRAVDDADALLSLVQKNKAVVQYDLNPGRSLKGPGRGLRQLYPSESASKVLLPAYGNSVGVGGLSFVLGNDVGAPAANEVNAAPPSSLSMYGLTAAKNLFDVSEFRGSTFKILATKCRVSHRDSAGTVTDHAYAPFTSRPVIRNMAGTVISIAVEDYNEYGVGGVNNMVHKWYTLGVPHYINDGFYLAWEGAEAGFTYLSIEGLYEIGVAGFAGLRLTTGDAVTSDMTLDYVIGRCSADAVDQVVTHDITNLFLQLMAQKEATNPVGSTLADHINLHWPSIRSVGDPAVIELLPSHPYDMQFWLTPLAGVASVTHRKMYKLAFEWWMESLSRLRVDKDHIHSLSNQLVY
jgi:hypothetical protein